jgi:FG-GAP repeat
VLHGRSSTPGPDADADEGFGSTLAAGDLDQDGHVDLAVGSAGSAFTDEPGHPGSVSACPGSPAGLTPCVRLDREPAYAMSTSLAIGNVSGTSRPEIVLGVPRADPERSKGGTVQILSLSGPRGSTTVRRTELTQSSKGVRGSNHAGDDFGAAVALGDLDRDGFADLVVGADGEDVGGHRDAGRVTVIYGGSTGYRRSGSRVYDQSTKGVPGKAEKHDDFGVSVALVDHDADGHLDLAVGAPGEDDGNGGFTTLRGSGRSFTTKDARTLTMRDLGYPDPRFAALGVAVNP